MIGVVGRFARKNLMVDPEAVRDLARRRGTSESAAVRDAVDSALATQDMVAALQRLHELGAFTDFDLAETGGRPAASRARKT